MISKRRTGLLRQDSWHINSCPRTAPRPRRMGYTPGRRGAENSLLPRTAASGGALKGSDCERGMDGALHWARLWLFLSWVEPGGIGARIESEYNSQIIGHSSGVVWRGRKEITVRVRRSLHSLRCWCSCSAAAADQRALTT